MPTKEDRDYLHSHPYVAIDGTLTAYFNSKALYESHIKGQKRLSEFIAGRKSGKTHRRTELMICIDDISVLDRPAITIEALSIKPIAPPLAYPHVMKWEINVDYRAAPPKAINELFGIALLSSEG